MNTQPEGWSPADWCKEADNMVEKPGVSEDPYEIGDDAIRTPPWPVVHHNDAYDEEGFANLFRMQLNHFWYRGRHRFLLHAVVKSLCTCQMDARMASAIDLGGGCGGWIHYLRTRAPALFSELALADSSRRALELARPLLAPDIGRYQTDLLHLGWRNRWGVGFLLDVIEHISDDKEAMRQVAGALRPGGFLFVTTPALQCFWTYNDEFAHHQKRYSRADFRRLADDAGLELYDARYFMFFLSPLVLLSRINRPKLTQMTREQICEHMARTHRVPAWPVNQLLGMVFGLETPLGHWLPFPWGTSILGVFRKVA